MHKVATLGAVVGHGAFRPHGRITDTAGWEQREVDDCEHPEGLCTTPGCFLMYRHNGCCAVPIFDSATPRTRRRALEHIEAPEAPAAQRPRLEEPPAAQPPAPLNLVDALKEHLGMSNAPVVGKAVENPVEKAYSEPSVAQVAPVEALLQRANLAEYTEAFLQEGWDDLEYLRGCDFNSDVQVRDGIRSIIAKPGHFARFLHHLGRCS